MRPTVYLVHYSCSPGGIEVLMPVIIKGLNQYQFKVFVIRPPDENSLNVYKGTDVEICFGSSVTLFALIKFWYFSLKNRNNIFHLFNAGPYFLSIARMTGVKKIVYSIHGTVYWKTSFKKWFRKLFWQLGISDKTIFTANSEYSANVFTNIVSDKVKPIVLYNPIDAERFSPKNKVDNNGAIKIVYAGRLVNGKNIEAWVDAAVFMLQKGIKANFELYGTGPKQMELQQYIGNSGFAKEITLRGHVEKIEDIYKNADLLLMLSDKESFGNVVVESILCGTPVITFDIPSMLEIFKEYPEFVIKNESEFKEHIYEKVKNIQELKKSAVSASENFSKRFGTAVHMDKLEAIYAK